MPRAAPRAWRVSSLQAQGQRGNLTNIFYVSRTTFFYLVAMLMNMANLTAPPMQSWTLASLVWAFSDYYTLACLLPHSSLTWAILGYRRHLSHHITTPRIVSYREAESLLRSSNVSPGSTAFIASDAFQSDHGAQSWCGAVHKLHHLGTSPSIHVLSVCSFLKRTALLSKISPVHYASKRYTLPYQQTVYFNGIQAKKPSGSGVPASRQYSLYPTST